MPDPAPLSSALPAVTVDLHDRRGALVLDVALTLHAGWTVLFGPSGSGKSTLLRLIAGLDRPQSGRIVIAPTSPTPTLLTDTTLGVHVPPERRGVRLLAQRPALFPHHSVLGNIAYATRHRRATAASKNTTHRNARLEQVIALCGIEPLLSRRPAALSGGERQRVALARTLMAEPTSLLLLDEPFTGLGAAVRDELIQQLRQWLAPQKIPVLLVTHDLGEVFATGGTLLKMEAGRITATGSAATVLATERAAMLSRLGSAPAE